MMTGKTSQEEARETDAQVQARERRNAFMESVNLVATGAERLLKALPSDEGSVPYGDDPHSLAKMSNGAYCLRTAMNLWEASDPRPAFLPTGACGHFAVPIGPGGVPDTLRSLSEWLQKAGGRVAEVEVADAPEGEEDDDVYSDAELDRLVEHIAAMPEGRKAEFKSRLTEAKCLVVESEMLRTSKHLNAMLREAIEAGGPSA